MGFSVCLVIKLLLLLHYGNCQLDVGYGDKSWQECVKYQQYVDRCTIMTNFIGQGKIVGGTEAEPGEFPHMALIGFTRENNEILWYCGGTLISDEFVITAAHCLYDRTWGEPKYVRLGVLQRGTNELLEQDYIIVELIRHPDYKRPPMYNDIALLRLNKKVRLNSYVRPACLHTNFYIGVKKAVATGWGRVGHLSDLSEHLLKVKLEFFSTSECNRSYQNFGTLNNGIVEATQVCAGHHTEAKDTCQADSGGPLQIIHPNMYCMWSLVGITSVGIGCGSINVPSVYTRVSNYIDWIEKIVWP